MSKNSGENKKNVTKSKEIIHKRKPMFSTIKNTEIKSNAVLFQTVEKWGTKHKSFITRGYDLNR